MTIQAHGGPVVLGGDKVHPHCYHSLIYSSDFHFLTCCPCLEGARFQIVDAAFSLGTNIWLVNLKYIVQLSKLSRCDKNGRCPP